MMKVYFIQTGKTSEKHVADGVEQYVARIRRSIPFETITVPAVRNSRAMPAEEVKKREGQAIMSVIPSDSYVILLDERGTEYSTTEFASFMRRSLSGTRRNICFVSGGAWGFSQEAYGRADMKLSLSKLTFPHQLVRLLFMEQLYRVLTLIEGKPYHHE
ncbi:MAG: 23S rRNA (pseudouridine(1915)-N(3))-methyltransferase RlmH [Bacteroidetes bacterium]|nr:23S rRNA (pseudouridine(1915)-N(3))-methyltransferase RlmH [Bacteroidota bacterium]